MDDQVFEETIIGANVVELDGKIGIRIKTAKKNRGKLKSEMHGFIWFSLESAHELGLTPKEIEEVKKNATPENKTLDPWLEKHIMNKSFKIHHKQKGLKLLSGKHNRIDETIKNYEFESLKIGEDISKIQGILLILLERKHKYFSVSHSGLVWFDFDTAYTLGLMPQGEYPHDLYETHEKDLRKWCNENLINSEFQFDSDIKKAVEDEIEREVEEEKLKRKRELEERIEKAILQYNLIISKSHRISDLNLSQSLPLPTFKKILLDNLENNGNSDYTKLRLLFTHLGGWIYKISISFLKKAPSQRNMEELKRTHNEIIIDIYNLTELIGNLLGIPLELDRIKLLDDFHGLGEVKRNEFAYRDPTVPQIETLPIIEISLFKLNSLQGRIIGIAGLSLTLNGFKQEFCYITK